MQVLQSSSSEAATQQISALIQERDDLQRQVTAYQNDRDQIINTLNVKHEESMSYYSEVERLSSLMSEVTEHKETLERNYSNLTLQYEDKQKSLVKALNELANYKQRLAESERCFSDVQGKLRNEMDGSSMMMDQSPNTFPPTLETPNIAALKQNYETALAERDERIAELGQLLDKNGQLLYEKEQQLNSKEQEMTRLMVKLHLAEANVSTKESELSSLRKQSDNLTFQLQGLTDERTELTNELDELRKRNEGLTADVQVIRQASNAMTVAVSNKDLEIATLTDKVKSLESVVQQRGENEVDGGHAEVEHLMREIETLRNQGQLLQQDRDRLYLAIHQFQAENTELKNEVHMVNVIQSVCFSFQCINMKVVLLLSFSGNKDRSSVVGSLLSVELKTSGLFWRLTCCQLNFSSLPCLRVNFPLMIFILGVIFRLIGKYEGEKMREMCISNRPVYFR